METGCTGIIDPTAAHVHRFHTVAIHRRGFTDVRASCRVREASSDDHRRMGFPGGESRFRHWAHR
jgi:hypothetical protein